MKPGPTSPAMTDADRAGDQSNWLHSEPDEFWARVRKTDCCWIFMKADWSESLQNSYGHFSYRGFTWRAHRLAYALTHGSIPEGLLVLHTCDVPCCVNPAHLFVGTDADNNQDKSRKVRAGRYNMAPPSVCPTCREPRDIGSWRRPQVVR